MSVVALWSATPPLAKIVMQSLSPLEFMGLRYSLAFLALTPVMFRKSWPSLRRLTGSSWLRLVLIGIIAYPIGNGLQFWALQYLPATTGTFTMNFVPLFTLLLGAVFLAERPSGLQWLGLLLVLIGAVIFFGLELGPADWIAISASSLGSLMLAIETILSRAFARSGKIDSVSLTAIPFGVGGGLLLVIAPAPRLPPIPVIGLILFLGIVSGALAFTFWNHALKSLQAFEITVIWNLMPMGTAVLAPWILGEGVPAHSWLGIIVALVGVIMVGLRVGIAPQIE